MKTKVYMMCIFLFLGHLGLNAQVISSPDSTSEWCVGKRYEIKWNPNSFNSTYVGIVLLKLNTSKTIIRKVENQGRYIWTIPTSITPGHTYRVQIVSGKKKEVKFTSSDFSISRCLTVKKKPGGYECEEHKNDPYLLMLLEFKLTPSGTDRFNYTFKFKNEGKRCLEAYHWEIWDHETQLITIGQGSLGSDGYMIHGNQTKTHMGAIFKTKCKNLGNCPDGSMECCNIKLYVQCPESGGTPGYNKSKWVTLDWGKMTFKMWTY